MSGCKLPNCSTLYTFTSLTKFYCKMNYDMIRIPLEKGLSDELFTLLEGNIIEALLKEAKVDRFQNEMKNFLEGNSFKVTREIAPSLWDSFQEVKKKLEFEEDIDFYVTSSPEINAYAALSLEPGKAHIINIYSSLIERMDDDELKFIIGHEMGHLISRNASITAILHFVYPDFDRIPILLYHKVNLWQKLAELTADRYGFIASPKLEKVVSNFFKLSSGLPPSRINLDFMAYLAKNEEIVEFFKNNPGENLSSHPINPIRIKALLAFSQSFLYQAVAGGMELKEDTQLSTQLDELLNIMMTLTNSELDYFKANYMAAAGIMIAGADEQMDQQELEQIISSLSGMMIFPQEMLTNIYNSGKVQEIFFSSASEILKRNPNEKYGMFEYLVSIAMADHDINEKEIEFLYAVGTQFGFSRQEIAQIVAGMVQSHFLPNVYSLK